MGSIRVWGAVGAGKDSSSTLAPAVASRLGARLRRSVGPIAPRPVIHEHAIGTPFEMHFAPTLEEASRARQSARVFLDDRSIDAAVAGDVELIVSELASNAVEQAPGSPVRLTIALIGSGVLVTVSNESAGDLPIAEWRPGTGPTPGGPELPDRGWGLGIVEALTDGLWCDEVDGWTSVACLRRFPS